MSEYSIKLRIGWFGYLLLALWVIFIACLAHSSDTNNGGYTPSLPDCDGDVTVLRPREWILILSDPKPIKSIKRITALQFEVSFKDGTESSITTYPVAPGVYSDKPLQPIEGRPNESANHF